MKSSIKYDIDWFTNRALSSLKKIDSNTWDYSDSLLLYLPSGEEKYKLMQNTDTNYYKQVTGPEREYLELISKDLINLLPPKFQYIDLGPGTEHKEQFLFDEIKKQGKEIVYIPVDISDHYLELAEKHASNQGIETKPIKASFEEVEYLLDQNNEIPRFVNLQGLTFSNYSPQVILKILKNLTGKNGYFFINAQIRDRIDLNLLQKTYQEDVFRVTYDKLMLLGLDATKDVTKREVNDEIKVWCNIINPSSQLGQKGVKKGDKLIVFQSLRYSKQQLEDELAKTDSTYKLFDIKKSFIGALVST